MSSRDHLAVALQSYRHFLGFRQYQTYQIFPRSMRGQVLRDDVKESTQPHQFRYSKTIGEAHALAALQGLHSRRENPTDGPS